MLSLLGDLFEYKVARFCVIGIFATLIHVLVASSLIGMELIVLPGIANGFAAMTAASFSYVGNTKWSFKKSFTQRNATRFVVTAVAGSSMAFALSSLADILGYHYLVGIGLVVVCVPIMSFLLHYYWTYRGE